MKNKIKMPDWQQTDLPGFGTDGNMLHFPFLNDWLDMIGRPDSTQIAAFSKNGKRTGQAAKRKK